MTAPTIKTAQSNRVWLTGTLVVVVSLFVLATALALAYQVAVEREAQRLEQFVASQAQLIEAVARFDARYSKRAVRGGPAAATMQQVRAALGQPVDQASAVTWVVARQARGLVEIDVGQLPGGANAPLRQLLNAALAGERGHWAGRDANGERVLAAYAPVPTLGAAVLARLPVESMLAPFLRAALIAGLVTFLLAGAAAIYVGGSGRALLNRLVDSESMFRAIFDSSPDAIVVLSDKLTVEDCNPTALSLTHMRREQLVGASIDKVRPVYQPNGERTDTTLKNALGFARSGRRMFGEYVFERADGVRFQAEVRVAQITVAGRTRFVVSAHDVTSRNRTREELRRAEMHMQHQREELAHASRVSAIGEMAAGIAHEINQPLTAMSSYSDAAQRMLADESVSRGTLRETLEKITQQAQRAAEVIERMRRFTRQDTGAKAVADMRDVVLDVVRLAETDTDRAGVHVEIDAPSYPLPVRMDRVQIQQVLLNLLRNAAEATEAAGSDEAVQVRMTMLRDRKVEVAVDDAGAGVPDADVERLFDPFFTTKDSGMGMGLSISHAIIDAHNGQLAHRPGRRGGAVFYFWVRLVDAKDEAAGGGSDD